jgi:chromosome transmission fidelity protein 1
MEPPENFDFPFQPYPIQHDFMRCLYDVIENKKLGIFESPTGTVSKLFVAIFATCLDFRGNR